MKNAVQNRARGAAQRGPTPLRIWLAERALGATVTFKVPGVRGRRKGRIVFVDLETLCVLLETARGQILVPLTACTVLSLRPRSVPVKYGVRLDVWQHGEGWRGVGIADMRVADAWLEPASEPVAA